MLMTVMMERNKVVEKGELGCSRHVIRGQVQCASSKETGRSRRKPLENIRRCASLVPMNSLLRQCTFFITIQLVLWFAVARLEIGKQAERWDSPDKISVIRLSSSSLIRSPISKQLISKISNSLTKQGKGDCKNCHSDVLRQPSNTILRRQTIVIT